MKKLFFCFLLLFSIAATAQTANKNGWRDLVWGNTVAMVKAKYKCTDYDKENKWCKMENFELSGKQFKVIFHFDKDDKLSSVVVARFQVMTNKERYEVDMENEPLKSDIEKGLTAKYGVPGYKNQSPFYERSWSFENLKIDFTIKVNYRPKLGVDGGIDESEDKHDIVMTDDFTIIYSNPKYSEQDKL